MSPLQLSSLVRQEYSLIFSSTLLISHAKLQAICFVSFSLNKIALDLLFGKKIFHGVFPKHHWLHVQTRNLAGQVATLQEELFHTTK